MELSTEHALRVLTHAGFDVRAIPRSTLSGESTADLLATKADETYVVEAKEREARSDWTDLIATATHEGLATTSRTVDARGKLANAISDQIKAASRQIESTERPDDALGILWYVAPNGDDDYLVATIEKRLNGAECISVFDGVELTMRDCYYHSSNDFERFPAIDAAVVGTRRGGRLLVNSYSPRRVRLRAGRLYAMFSERRAVVDPEVEASALMIGADFVGPRDARRQWEYLRDRYGLFTSPGIDSQFTGIGMGTKPDRDA